MTTPVQSKLSQRTTALAIMESPDPTSLKYCSFCGKSQHEVEKLVAGPSVFICNECIELCAGIVQDERLKATEREHSHLMARTPESLVMEADSCVPGQRAAKQVLAVDLLKRGHEALYSPQGMDRTILVVVGPTGCGKRRLVSHMARALSLPQLWIDIPLLLPHASFRTAYEIKDFGERPGVIVFNYLDALLTSRNSESAWQLQHALVSILDSAELRLGEGPLYRVNTRRAIFVGICDLEMGQALDPSNSPERLIEAEFIPALAARFTSLAPFGLPDLSDYESMLYRPGGLIEQCQEHLRRYGRTVRLAPEAVQLIARIAERRKQGLSGLQAIMNHVLHGLSLRNGNSTREEVLNTESIAQLLGAI